MSQPVWKLIANLGDVGCPDYTGYFLFEDETGVYAPELERIDPNDPDDCDDSQGEIVAAHAIALQAIYDGCDEDYSSYDPEEPECWEDFMRRNVVDEVNDYIDRHDETGKAAHITSIDFDAVDVAESLIERVDSRSVEIRRICLDRCTLQNGILSDNPYHPDHPAWFADDIQSVADYADMPDIVECLCSDDIGRRAFAYMAIADYHGWDNFDEYPFEMTYAEANDRIEGFKATGC